MFKTKDSLTGVFVFLLLGLSINFFSPKALNGGLFSPIRYAGVFLAIAVSIPYMLRATEANRGLGIPIKWIFAAQLLSTTGAFFSWGQGFANSLQPLIFFAQWPVFFYLIQRDYPVEKLGNIVLIFGLAYFLCYAYQYMHSDTVIFGAEEEFREERGVTRINFPGGGVLFFSAFLALNRATDGERRYRLVYAGYALAALVVTVMQVTRQNIAVVLLIYTWHLLRRAKPVWKIGLMVAAVAAVVIVLNTDNPIVKGLEEQQSSTMAQGENYIRVLSGTYFLTEFSPDLFARVVGNGPPYLTATSSSRLGEKAAQLKEMEGYYLSDVGIIGAYAMFGVLAIVGYAVLFVKGLRTPVPDEFVYLKYYIWFVILTSFTSDSIFSPNYLMTTIFACYGLQVCYLNSRYTYGLRDHSDQL